MAIKNTPAQELLERFDVAREKLGKNSFEARVLRMMAHRIVGAFQYVEAFKAILNESSTKDPGQVVRHIEHYLQGAHFLQLTDPIIELVKGEGALENSADVNSLRAQIQALGKYATQQISDKHFNPMSSTCIFINSANVEKHKTWIEIYNIFKFVENETI